MPLTFGYNFQVHRTTGTTLFGLVLRREPNEPVNASHSSIAVGEGDESLSFEANKKSITWTKTYNDKTGQQRIESEGVVKVVARLSCIARSSIWDWWLGLRRQLAQFINFELLGGSLTEAWDFECFFFRKHVCPNSCSCREGRTLEYSITWKTQHSEVR